MPKPVPAHPEHIAMVARWKPVHRGHAVVLQALCDHAPKVTIGIGSSNRCDHQNPFTADETEQMIRLVLQGRRGVRIVRVPDVGHGPRWRSVVQQRMGTVDLFVTANGWVASLLGDVWPLEHPVALVPPERRVRVNGTMVREAMAFGEPWAHLVPPQIADFLRSRKLVERFCLQHGAAARRASGRD